jgi:hypothetical protein
LAHDGQGFFLAAALLCAASAVDAFAQTATPRYRLAIVGLT